MNSIVKLWVSVGIVDGSAWWLWTGGRPSAPANHKVRVRLLEELHRPARFSHNTMQRHARNLGHQPSNREDDAAR